MVYLDQILVFNQPASNATGNTGTDLFRDTTSWYHAVLSNEVGQLPRLWVNGVEVALSGSAVCGPISQVGNLQRIGRLGLLSHASKAYIAQAIMVDGQALQADSFGEFSDEGYWQPVQYPVGATGSQGYILNFEDSSNLGLDSSTNGNNFTVVGTVTQVSDTVTDNHSVLDERADEIGKLIITHFSSGIKLLISKTKVHGILNTISLGDELSNLEILNLTTKLDRLQFSNGIQSVARSLFLTDHKSIALWRNDLHFYGNKSEAICQSFVHLLLNFKIQFQLKLVEGDHETSAETGVLLLISVL